MAQTRGDMGASALRPLPARRERGDPATSQRLAELSHLDVDWDTYGGLPPTPTAIEAARQLLALAASATSMNGHAMTPDAVLPFPNGGVQLIWERGADELQVDIGPTGDLGYLLVSRTGDRREATEAEAIPLDEILALVGQFLS